MEQKTILEWFQYAKEQGYDWADAAIANCDEDCKNERTLNLTLAICYAFIWNKSPEGSEFWEKIAVNIYQ